MELAQRRTGGEPGWIRTSDPCLKRALLYQLSYGPPCYESNTSAARLLTQVKGRP
jgi:hypothetical protein